MYRNAIVSSFSPLVTKELYSSCTGSIKNRLLSSQLVEWGKQRSLASGSVCTLLLTFYNLYIFRARQLVASGSFEDGDLVILTESQSYSVVCEGRKI